MSLRQWLAFGAEYRGIFPRYLPWRKISGTAQHYFLCQQMQHSHQLHFQSTVSLYQKSAAKIPLDACDTFLTTADAGFLQPCSDVACAVSLQQIYHLQYTPWRCTYHDIFLSLLGSDRSSRFRTCVFHPPVLTFSVLAFSIAPTRYVCLFVCCRGPAERLGRSRPNLA